MAGDHDLRMLSYSGPDALRDAWNGGGVSGGRVPHRAKGNGSGGKPGKKKPGTVASTADVLNPGAARRNGSGPKQGM